MLDAEKLGPTPEVPLSADEHARNNLPDILARWDDLATEADRPRTAQSFMVSAEDIAETGSWDLSLNRYKQVEYAEVEHESPAAIIAELRAIEAEIAKGLDRLEEMLA